MIKNIFFLRIISLSVILSNLTLLGGDTLLPKALAQSDPTAHSQKRDLFCEEGTKITGFPYGLFDWDEVPWGMPGDEFLRLFEERIRQCTGSVWSGPLGISTYKSSPISDAMTSVDFEFEGENNTLSRIEISNNGAVRHHLLERFGLPQKATYTNARVPVGCIQVGIACRRIYEYADRSLYHGDWMLNDTWVMVRTWSTTTLAPVEPSLRTVEKPSCERFIVFKFCD